MGGINRRGIVFGEVYAGRQSRTRRRLGAMRAAVFYTGLAPVQGGVVAIIQLSRPPPVQWPRRRRRETVVFHGSDVEPDTCNDIIGRQLAAAFVRCFRPKYLSLYCVRYRGPRFPSRNHENSCSVLCFFFFFFFLSYSNVRRQTTEETRVSPITSVHVMPCAKLIIYYIQHFNDTRHLSMFVTTVQ